MQDPIGIPACFFSSGEKQSDDDHHHHQGGAVISRSGQSVFMSVYRTKLGDQSRLITITWCRNMMLHGLSVSVEGVEGDESQQYTCKVELKPWYFWRKHGSKRFLVDGGGKAVDIFWDLRAARFNGETEPVSGYYVAVVCDQQVVLLLGDLKKEAYKKTNSRPALIDPVLVSKKEHIFGKRKFSTRVKFHGKGGFHEISIECKSKTRSSSSVVSSSNGFDFEPEMEIRIDGHLVIHVKHLQWKFRGNESIHVNKVRIEVYWDVHDWLFSPGLRHALFIFKPVVSSTSLSPISRSSSSSSPPLSSSSTSTPLSSLTGMSSASGSIEGLSSSGGSGSSEFCLFLYAWKVE